MNKISQNFNIIKTNNPKQAQRMPVSSPLCKIENKQHSVLPLNSLNKYMVNFTGLNRNLSKMAYESLDSVKAEVAIFPKSNGIVGNLPAEWVQKIPKENRASSIKGLYSDLKSIVNDFRTNDFENQETPQKLTNAFIKEGAIQKSENIELLHLGCGKHGHAFRLKGLSGDKYIIKVFKADDELSDFHGKYIEPNRAAFWKKNAGKNTQMAPFHFADAETGYIVSNYIDADVPKFKKNIIPESLGLKSLDISEKDNGLNKINGFQIEYGGLEISENKIVKDKRKQAEFRKFFTLPAEKQLESLDKADDTIKMHTLSKLNLQPKNERSAYFKQISANAGENVKIKLTEKFYFLPEEEKIFNFEQLAKDASDELKINLADTFYCLPENSRADCFKMLYKNSSDDVKLNLIPAVKQIPQRQQAECYKLLTKTNNKEIIEKLKEDICYLPKKEWEEVKKLLNLPTETRWFSYFPDILINKNS